MRRPAFWATRNVLSLVLRPAAALYSIVTRWRSSRIQPYHATVPVICVGNHVLGGAGKTPTVLALIPLLHALGHHPHILSRGYGGYTHPSPHRVDPLSDTPQQVGDEPLLLARAAPCWVCTDRPAAAQAATAAGATLLIMDDGLQNPSLHKDMTLLVVDGSDRHNNLTFPAGPLRESLSDALDRVQGVVALHGHEGLTADHPIWEAVLQPDLSAIDRNRPAIAFAGIGRPEKFFTMLEQHGIPLTETHTFPDHHFYTARDIQTLLQRQHALNAQLLTTEKDAVKWPAEKRHHLTVIPAALCWRDEARLILWLKQHLSNQ
jgi:tetraacyldisaccharide 4'-kinase